MCIAVAAGVAVAVINGRHRHSYEEEVTPPTCTEQGFTLHTCECGNSYKDNYIEATGHSYEDGKCGICGYEHPHEYEKSITAPTCQQKGYTTYSCICGVSYTADETEIIDHNYVNGKCNMCGIDHDCEYTPTVTPPTCTASGFTTYACTCGASYEGNYTEPIGHDYGEEVTQPTCTGRGYTIHTCSACGRGYIDSYTDPLDHNYVDGQCTRCNKIKPTDGLKYTLSDDGTYYICSGTGTATGTDIVIPSEYNGIPVTEIGGEGAYWNYSITSIIIPESITAIAPSVFYFHSKLKSITVADGNTVYHSRNNCLIETKSKTLIYGCGGCIIPDDGSVTSIGQKAFYYNETLTDLIIPDCITSIGESAFTYCTNLTSLTIPNGVTNIDSSAFIACHSLTSIIISEGVTEISDNAFAFCRSLTEVTIHDSVRKIDYNAFSYCEKLKDIYFIGTAQQWQSIEKGSGWDINTGNYAVHCTDGDISNKYTEGLAYTLSDDGTYYICSGIGTANATEIVIASTYDGKPVTAIAERAFKDCKNITGVFIPDGITSIGNYAFGNIGITRLVIPDSVTVIENYAFYGCTNLVEITIPAGVTSLESYTFTNCTNLKTIIFKGTMEQWNSGNRFRTLTG